jgi:hypothetical protein
MDVCGPSAVLPLSHESVTGVCRRLTVPTPGCAISTTAITSPASGPVIVKPRIRSPFASISALVNPRASSIVRFLSTAVIGILATHTAIPGRFASVSVRPQVRNLRICEETRGDTSRRRLQAIVHLHITSLIQVNPGYFQSHSRGVGCASIAIRMSLRAIVFSP